MKVKIFVIILFILSLTGCFLDRYTNQKYGKQVVESWFSYKIGNDDLGKVRRNIENIYEIEDTVCDYVTKYKKNYVFNCKITYKENSDTIIPFSESKILNVYAVFTPLKNKQFTYKVYNSSSEENIWEKDSELE